MLFEVLLQAYRTFRSRAIPSDYVLLCYTVIVLTLIVLFRENVPHWGGYAVAHVALVGLIIFTSVWGHGAMHGLRRFWRFWDVAFFIPALFWMNLRLVHLIQPEDADRLLIRWDQAIGGIELLQWTMTWSTPLTDEISKLVWASYFLLPLILGGTLYLARRDRDFEEVKLILVLGWILCYMLYFVFPAQGPLFFENELGLAEPSAGLTLAGPLQEMIDAGHGTMARDSFPSGHTMIAFLVLVLSLRHRLWKTSLLIVPLALGIIASTLTLRYHYVVDVVAGLILSIPVLWIGFIWYRRYAESRHGFPNPALSLRKEESA